MYHHTKNKGDVGVGFVIADLMSKGIHVCLPISEHLPFDLIAVYPEGRLSRLSVKYRSVTKGRIEVGFKSTYSTSKGISVVPIDKYMVDAIAIYCPDTKEVYYVDHHKFNTSVILRIDPPMNNQTKGVNFARNFRDPFDL
ncbi:group I intron-associated PD-(D/E)XK endonuclease [Neolewinella agarilytica]|uniref:PD(D/E)XK endonuclease domain-containing protein n=1 Tax=Neolewinella agarilytica TaxID=478744 RepID=A0A1H9JS57_9BACT|nr:group I intron-associated PD-(D/E)XK endonuclease [Neolewinella agarilytica]SEQ89667.1 hypothetical protein SAMN05444359_11848 [Neolewinella agarilytica]